MASTPTAPADYVYPGAEVAVILPGAVYARREVAKVNAKTFTVHGVTTMTGAGERLMQFSNRHVSEPRNGLAPSHEAAGDNRGMVVPAGDPRVATKLAAIREGNAAQRVQRAADAWAKVEYRRTGRTTHAERPTAAEVDEALVEMANAALAMRELLGVPEGAPAETAPASA